MHYTQGSGAIERSVPWIVLRKRFVSSGKQLENYPGEELRNSARDSSRDSSRNSARDSARVSSGEIIHEMAAWDIFSRVFHIISQIG